MTVPNDTATPTMPLAACADRVAGRAPAPAPTASDHVAAVSERRAGPLATLRGHCRRGARGFTMLEMLIVVALIGIVATLALPSYRHATDKARESVLRENLWVMRDVIDQFYTDKGRYPSSLEELVSAGYLRRIPVDPITESSDTWEVTYEPLAEDLSDGPEFEEPGITDIRSGAGGRARDGSYYNEW